MVRTLQTMCRFVSNASNSEGASIFTDFHTLSYVLKVGVLMGGAVFFFYLNISSGP